MTEPWALTATAGEVDANDRAAAAHEMGDFGGGILLATCHRAELYGVGAMPRVRWARALRGGEAVEHLLRVASGLESVIVGEDEVLHQVRQALARKADPDRRLLRLFQTAIATGRKARSGRTESSGNLAQRAVEWLQRKTEVSGRTVVVAGAGRMGATLAHAVTEAGADVVISSRSANRAALLARVYAGRGVGLVDGAFLAREASAVAVALGGPWTELGGVPHSDLPPIADISAPQAVPDKVRRGMNGSFLGIDDLYRQVGPIPGAYIKDAEALVARAVAEYMDWLERKS